MAPELAPVTKSAAEGAAVRRVSPSGSQNRCGRARSNGESAPHRVVRPAGARAAGNGADEELRRRRATGLVGDGTTGQGRTRGGAFGRERGAATNHGGGRPWGGRRRRRRRGWRTPESDAMGNGYAGHGRSNGWSLRVPTAMLSTMMCSSVGCGSCARGGDEIRRRR